MLGKLFLQSDQRIDGIAGFWHMKLYVGNFQQSVIRNRSLYQIITIEFMKKAAVFYELKDRVKTIRLKPVEESETVGFEAILKNLTAAELKSFIAVYARDDKNFKRQFELYFANRD